MPGIQAKPYEMIGAGKLSSAVYKTGDQLIGWHYHFNVYRTDFSSGQLSHWLHPEDLRDLLKLIQVIGLELLNDGCLLDAQRKDLDWIVKCLEAINCTSPKPKKQREATP